MAKDPFYYRLDEDLRGCRVRAHTPKHVYEGWVRMWHYDDHGLLLYDVERDDGEELGTVVLDTPEAVERLESTGPIREIEVDMIQPSRYSARTHDDPDHREFVRETRERGHLLTFPTVRRSYRDDFETVGGHRRMEAARRAGLDTVAVRVLDLDEWEATQRFVDEHIPIQGGNEHGMYSQQEVDTALDHLLDVWTAETLHEIDPLKPYLKEKLSSTRREALRHEASP